MKKELELFMKQFLEKFNQDTQDYFMEELLKIINRYVKEELIWKSM